MDANRFDAFVRSLPTAFSRRATLAGMVGLGLSALLGWPGGDDAEAKKKRRKKKKKKKCKGKKKRCGTSCCPRAECIGGACCPAGSICGVSCCGAGESCLGGACCPAGNVCGSTCCGAGESCLGGACCPTSQTCGAVCCPAGQRCGDPASGQCVAGQGTCAAGADSCAANNFIFCNGSNQCICAQATDGTTRCAQPIPEITVADCGLCSVDADCALQFPAVVGVFCANDAINVCGCPAGQNLCAAPCPAT